LHEMETAQHNYSTLLLRQRIVRQNTKVVLKNSSQMDCCELNN